MARSTRRTADNEQKSPKPRVILDYYLQKKKKEMNKAISSTFRAIESLTIRGQAIAYVILEYRIRIIEKETL